MADFSPQWPDDNLIADLIFRMSNEAAELTGDPGFRMTFDNHLWMDVSTILTISPPVVWETQDNLIPILHERYAEQWNATIGSIHSSLSDWDGVAAEAFRTYVEDVDSFRDSQRTHMERLLHPLATAYTFGVQVREDYKALAEAWIKASQKFREDEADKRIAVSLKVGSGVVATAIATCTSSNPVAAGFTAISGAATAAVEGYTAYLGGDTIDDVLRSYDSAFAKLRSDYDIGVDQIGDLARKYLSNYLQDVPAVLTPLPSAVDVDSPDFRYEYFRHDHRQNPGMFEGRSRASGQTTLLNEPIALRTMTLRSGSED